MTIPTKVEINTETGAISEIPLNDAELAQRELDIAAAEEARLAREAEAERIASLKASAKAKLIAGEALTEEEADLLVI